VPEISKLCVFCGSRTGDDPAYIDATISFGKALAARNIDLVYGGGSVGLMGVLADTMLDAGREVIGVIPHGLFELESAYGRITEMHEVDSMHERKQLMYELADGYVTLPGGYGTLEEFAEITTWAQLGLHREPIGLLDVRGYFAPLIAFLDHAVTEGFLDPDFRALVLDDTDHDRLLDRMAAYEPPELGRRWLDTPAEA
jgi:uncharacterized protein (TIGR00730 family)